MTGARKNNFTIFKSKKIMLISKTNQWHYAQLLLIGRNNVQYLQMKYLNKYFTTKRLPNLENPCKWSKVKVYIPISQVIFSFEI